MWQQEGKPSESDVLYIVKFWKFSEFIILDVHQVISVPPPAVFLGGCATVELRDATSYCIWFLEEWNTWAYIHFLPQLFPQKNEFQQEHGIWKI